MSAGHTNPQTSRWVLAPLVATLLFIAYLAFLVFRPFCLVFAVAASVAMLLKPMQRRLRRWLGGRDGWAAGLVVALVVLVILVPVTAAAGILGNQAVAFFEWVRPYLEPGALDALFKEVVATRAPWLGKLLQREDEMLSRFVASSLSGLAQGTNGYIQSVVTGLTTAAFDLLLFVLMLFFLLRDGSKLRLRVQAISPLSDAQEQAVLEHLGRTVKGVLLAMLLVPLVQGAVAFLGFVALGVPSPLLWSLFVVMAALIPVLGSPLGWVPAVVYLFFEGAGLRWVWMLLFGFFGISAIDNFVKPWLLREAAQIHPMLGFLSILGGVLAFGPMGFLIGPMILSLVLSAVTIYRADVLRSDPPPAAE